jgi:hypothetical protein
MKARKLKFGAGILGLLGLGVGIPTIACQWQFMKARG